MLKRIMLYLNAMFPPVQRLVLAAGMFAAIYLLIGANYRVGLLAISVTDIIVVGTVFTFLLSLRIADEFKDLTSDYQNFPNRPLPSGKVTKRDLLVLLAVVQAPVIVLNLSMMNNRGYFITLWLYGGLMSCWFFARRFIQPNMHLVLITHNPVQLLLGLYIASYVSLTYGLNVWSGTVVLVIIALYLPGLIWEISRKIRRPRDETAYMTYSRLWGYKPATAFVGVLIGASTALNARLVMDFSKPAASLVVLGGGYGVYMCWRWTKHPNAFALLKVTTIYIYSQQLILITAAAVSLWRAQA